MLYNINKPRCIFFEDEYRDKREIALSLISNRMYKTAYKIAARKCSFVKIPNNVSKIFFDQNHIAGAVQSSFSFGLIYNQNLVACISFRKPFIKKYGNAIEIARFASSKNLIVQGGLSKLLVNTRPILKETGYDKILTYADRKLGEGNSYQKVGFKHIDITNQDYFYSDGENRFNRFKFRATKEKSEKEVAIDNNVFRVYGLGSAIFIKDI
jgi:hypothetical protein